MTRDADDPLHLQYREGGPPLQLEKPLSAQTDRGSSRAQHTSVRHDAARRGVRRPGREIPKSIMHHWMKKLEFQFECGEKKLSGLG